MTSPRTLSNQAKWTLEDIYAALLEAERHVSPLISEPHLTRTHVISAAALTVASIRLAREHITRVHAGARDIVVKRGRGVSGE